MERLDYDFRWNNGFAALLYHPPHPCANPRPSAMMNKQQATTVRAR
jgi:hypothetical protein